MEKNIFENAYFGKPYKTRDGSKAIFMCKRRNFDQDRPYACIVEGYDDIFSYYPNGRLYFLEKFETENDIISEWEEEINEDELDKLAEEYELKQRAIVKQGYALGQCIGFDYITGFKDGYRYRKAKEGK